MLKISLRGGSADPERKCSRCRQNPYELTVDEIDLCEECLVRAVHTTSGDTGASRTYEVNLLLGDLARLTGRTHRAGKAHGALPTEEIVSLRRALRDIEDTKARANSKLRRFGLPGV